MIICIQGSKYLSQPFRYSRDSGRTDGGGGQKSAYSQLKIRIGDIDRAGIVYYPRLMQHFHVALGGILYR